MSVTPAYGVWSPTLGFSTLALTFVQQVQNFIARDIYADAAYLILGLFVLFFLSVGRKEIGLLFSKPPRLGTGLSRIWAVARVSIAEAIAARVYVVPLVWFFVCLIINVAAVRYYSVTEEISLYIRVLLIGQEFVVIVTCVVLAIYSIPQERERRTIVTTGSKPLSRLEFLIGKIVGFGTVALFLLLVMGLFTLGFLFVSDYRIRQQARGEYADQKNHYLSLEKNARPPEESLLEVARTGTLVAQNYIAAPQGVSVAGAIIYKTDPPTRLIKGGSQQTVYFHLPELPASGANPNRPYFFFQFPFTFAPDMKEIPQEIEMNVTIQLAKNPRASFDKTVRLNLANVNALTQVYQDDKEAALRASAGDFKGVAYYNLTPPDDSTFFSYSTDPSEGLGPVLVKIRFPQPGVYMGLIDKMVNTANVEVFGLDSSRLQGATGKETIVLPNAQPFVTGFEKHDMQQIAGPENADAIPEIASYHFTDVKEEDVPLYPTADGSGKEFHLTVNFDADKGRKADQLTKARVTIYSQFDPSKRIDKVIDVEEKRDVTLSFPAEGLITKAPSDLVVNVECLTTDHWVALRDNSVRLSQPSSWFTVNLLKSELMIFCECLLVITIAVTASVRLGWPTAFLLTATIVALGYVFEFVQKVALEGTDSLLNAATRQQLKGTVMYAASSAVSNGSSRGLYLLVNLVPNFSKFDYLTWITDSRNMPSVFLLGCILMTVAYALPFIGLGFLLIRKQELA